MIKIYTDGSCKGNGTEDSVGAWAYVVLDETEEKLFEDSSAQYLTTNNRMEMTAILEGITRVSEYLSELGINKPMEIEVYTDSAYVHNSITQKWYKNWQKNGWVNSSKQPVKNKDLWELLIPYFENPRFAFYKVRGHTGNKDWNDYVDKLAQSAAAQLKRVAK